MPSLRRTASSPPSVVRSSPYSSAQTRASHPRRASAGSETSNRRVLGDLDWWAVMDGQSSTAPMPMFTTTNDHNENNFFLPLEQRFNAPADAEPITRPVTPIQPPVNTSETRITLGSPMREFAALSIAPRAVPLNIRRHTSPGSTSSSFGFCDDSFSSAGSSPDLSPVPLTPPPSENFSFFMNFDDKYIPAFHAQSSTPPRPSLRTPRRAVSYSGYSPCGNDELDDPMFGFDRGLNFQTLGDDDYFH